MKHRRIALLILLVLATFGASKAYAQQSKIFNIGYVTFWSDAFKTEMAKLGYVEGQNVNYRLLNFANLKPEQYADAFTAQVKDMVTAGTDVFVTNTDSDAVNLLPLVGNTPIVFTISDDPISTGAVKSLIHPGGTMTGSVTNNPNERRLQILTEMKPSTKKVYFVYATQYKDSDTRLKQVQELAKKLNIDIVLAPVTDLASGLEALKQMPDGIDWIYLTPFTPLDPPFFQALLDLSKARHIPVSGFTDNIFQSWTMGYGPDLLIAAQQSADITDRILRGASPAELPVETADNLLMVNLDTAQVINMQMPEIILRQADLIVHPGDFAKTPTPPPAATQAATQTAN